MSDLERAFGGHLTVGRRYEERLPADRNSVEEIPEYFGPDKCLQTGVADYIPLDVPLDYYKDYVALLHEYCAKATHEDGRSVPCPILGKNKRE